MSFSVSVFDIRSLQCRNVYLSQPYVKLGVTFRHSGFLMSETILGWDLGSWLVITQVEARALIKGPLSIFRVSPLANM